jgi:hypothetical protein
VNKLVGLLVLLALLLVVDRGAAALAGRVVAEQAQTAGGLSARPDVSVQGFPFLTQAVRGRYDRVEVAASQVPAGELVVDLDATLSGVEVPLSQALSGDVAEVPVERLASRALVPYEELSRRSGSRALTVSAAGDRVRVEGSVEVLGRTVAAAAVSRVVAEGGALVVTAERFEVGNGVADALLSTALGDRFDLRVPVALPYGLVLEGVEVRPDGVVVRASAADVVLRAR